MPLSRRLVLLGLLLWSLAGGLGAAGCGGHAGAAATSRPSAPVAVSPSVAPAAKVSAAAKDYSELSYKADLAENLAEPPELIFYGGSRSSRFDPDYAERITGLRAFNFAITNSRPTGAWALANWLLGRAPSTKLRWVWGVQPSTLWERDLDRALVGDARFSPYFPADVLEAGTVEGAAGAATPRWSPLAAGRRYTTRGLLLWNAYDRQKAHGRTLERSLADYIAKSVARARSANPHAGGSREREYFERTLALLNAHGTTPLIVLMPVHPEVLEATRVSGGQHSRERLLAYLSGLRGRYRFELLDLTETASFGGDPREFYDGVHMTRENANRAIAAMAGAAGAALD